MKKRSQGFKISFIALFGRSLVVLLAKFPIPKNLVPSCLDKQSGFLKSMLSRNYRSPLQFQRMRVIGSV